MTYPYYGGVIRMYLYLRTLCYAFPGRFRAHRNNPRNSTATRAVIFEFVFATLHTMNKFKRLYSAISPWDTYTGKDLAPFERTECNLYQNTALTRFHATVVVVLPEYRWRTWMEKFNFVYPDTPCSAEEYLDAFEAGIFSSFPHLRDGGFLL